MFCAIPPVDMANSHVGRGYGFGPNRLHTRMDQLHGGQDYSVAAHSPIVAALAGRVVLIGSDANRTTASAHGLMGYGNSVVIETRGAIPGMPNPFYALYAHMDGPPAVAVGQQVQAGTLLGHVGNTSNGQFAGLPFHLHLELRRRPYPSSYDHDTIDPNIMWQGVGVDLIGSHQEAGRRVGGTLQVRAGGPSDCRAGQASALSRIDPLHAYLRGLGVVYGPSTSGQASAGEQYLPPSTLSPNYPGVTADAPDVDPPDYSSLSSGGGTGAVIVVGAAALAALAIFGSSR